MLTKKTLTNFKVVEKTDVKGQNYYIIFDNNNQNGNNAYFCWNGTVKTGWTDLLEKRTIWKEIEIEYEEKEKGNKVVNIWSDTDELNFLI